MNRYEVIMRNGNVYPIVAEDWTSKLDGKLIVFTDDDGHIVKAFPTDAIESWGDA